MEVRKEPYDRGVIIHVKSKYQYKIIVDLVSMEVLVRPEVGDSFPFREPPVDMLDDIIRAARLAGIYIEIERGAIERFFA